MKSAPLVFLFFQGAVDCCLLVGAETIYRNVEFDITLVVMCPLSHGEAVWLVGVLSNLTLHVCVCVLKIYSKDRAQEK